MVSNILLKQEHLIMNDISYIILACHIDKGMKSFGSKGLLEFHNKKIFNYQIEWIKKQNHNNYEIIIISNFDTIKIQRSFSDTIKVVECDTNPILKGCLESKYNNLIFIDYGCLFNPKILKKIQHLKSNYAITISDINLDIGCIIDHNRISHIYLDHKFSNIFKLNHTSKLEIINNSIYDRSNLLYFETLNTLINNGNTIENIIIDKKDFLYFKHMDQKHAINKFLKRISNPN
jgi:hypothetical protein